MRRSFLALHFGSDEPDVMLLKAIMDIPFTVSPSVSSLVLHAEEDGETYLDLIAWYEKQEQYERVRIKFKRCVGARQYAMGGEGKCGLGVLTKSNWLDELNKLQVELYPDYPDNFRNIRHYYFQGHDCSVEVLAEEVTYETINVLENW